MPFSNLGVFSPLLHSLQLCFYLPHPDMYISCCFRETKRSKIIWVSLFLCFAHYSFFNTRKAPSWAGLCDIIVYSVIIKLKNILFHKTIYRIIGTLQHKQTQTQRISKTPDEGIQHKKELVPVCVFLSVADVLWYSYNLSIFGVILKEICHITQSHFEYCVPLKDVFFSSPSLQCLLCGNSWLHKSVV